MIQIAKIGQKKWNLLKQLGTVECIPRSLKRHSTCLFRYQYIPILVPALKISFHGFGN